MTKQIDADIQNAVLEIKNKRIAIKEKHLKYMRQYKIANRDKIRERERALYQTKKINAIKEAYRNFKNKSEPDNLSRLLNGYGV